MNLVISRVIILAVIWTAHHCAIAQNDKLKITLDRSVEWAINVGGGDYLGADGISYQADPILIDTPIQSPIKGAQDDTVFKTYKLGVNEINKPIGSGVYDLIFKFSEPENLAIGSRVFNVLVEGQVVIRNLDVIQARDGNMNSSLVRMVNNIEIDDGALNIELESVVGEPILNAVVVRKKIAITEGWELIWQDEFDYVGTPDQNKWTHDVWPAKKVNDEDQAYTSRKKNARVENGLLIIEAHREDYHGAQYTSARLHSAGKGDLLYGRVEVRAKLPAGQGTWPAIWMLPSDPFRYATTCAQGEDWQGSDNCDAWPNSGEIDIMEHVGYDMNRVHGTVHTQSYYWVNGEQRKASVEAQKVDQQFHIYSMQWSPQRIDVYFDGALYFTYLNQGEGWQAWPYDHPFHLILNLAVGGGWGGAGGATDTTAFPAKMLVDYVRVYQKEETVAQQADK